MAPATEDQGTPQVNPLISTQGSSELQVILHPLVLLSISDYITRHTLRKQDGPLIGALLGQQNGREITIEHAFDVHTQPGAQASGGYSIHLDGFQKRYEQMKKVHQDRQLDFVGWYTLLPLSGPSPSILDLHRIFLSEYNESAILLAFHPDQVLSHSAGGTLPLTIYESNWEVEGSGKAAPDSTEDRNMDDAEVAAQIRFRELHYSVETDETEMISMNYVAGGGGSAAVNTPKEEKPSRSIETNSKGKRRIVENEAEEEKSGDEALTREEEEIIAALTAKANAIKMLQSRIQLIGSYLAKLPPSFVNGEPSDDDSMDVDSTVPSLPVLRQIQALISRLDLIIPLDKESFEQEFIQQVNDVNLTELLNNIMQSTTQAREVGKKFGVVEHAKPTNRRGDFETQAGPYSILNSAGDIII
uniref:COP9 signalosome complex subunit 6 n=1 Tax=Bionectria ochroleuca TaxID=29856 RepID=A0A8H7NNZ2_BIOOC